MTPETESHEVFSMFEQPPGWIDASLPKFMEASAGTAQLCASQDKAMFERVRTTLQEERWLQTTGIPASDTHCTIIIPVHNEQRALPSSLGALLMSDIPSTADVAFVFVVNASVDQSASIIRNQLARINPVIEEELPPSTHDSMRKKTAIKTQYGNISFTLVETATAGKANALNIGNEIALANNHTVAMNIDANNWPEPDTVAQLYGLARKHIIDNEKNDTALVDGLSKQTIKTHLQGNLDRLLVWARKNIPSTNGTAKRPHIMGWLFAWNPQWIPSIGGFPSTATEDKATAFEAYIQGKKIYHGDAPIWGYISATTEDKQKEYIRYLLGTLQILDKHGDKPDVVSLLQVDYPLLKPLSERLKFYIVNRLKGKNAIKFPFYVLGWLRYELGLRKAQKLMRENPHQQTWEPIRSTK